MGYELNPKLPKKPAVAVVPESNKVVIFEGTPGEGQTKATQDDLKALYSAKARTRDGLPIVIKTEKTEARTFSKSEKK